jgi:hypothetical protein
MIKLHDVFLLVDYACAAAAGIGALTDLPWAMVIKQFMSISNMPLK